MTMEKINAAKVKKATDFLEKWKKFQDEKGQRRVSLATKPSPQDGNELKKKAGKKVVTSRYLSHKTEPNVPKQTTAQTKPSNPQKRISILPQPRPNGTPMSIRLERWRKQKEGQKENILTASSARKKTQTPFKTNKKYTHVKSKIMTASTQKHVEKQNTDQTDSVKKMLTSTTKHNKTYKIPGAKSNASKTTSSSQIRKNHSTPAVINKKSNGQGPSVQHKSNRFQFKVSEAKNNRRHSDSQSRNTKATRSILKRKSCLPSLSDEMMLPESEALKMPGHNVRFISPILPHPEHQSFRKTPNRLVHRSMRSELEEWLKKRGKTPSGFRHLRCFDATLSAKKKSSNQACNTEKESENVSKPLRSSVVLNLEDQFCVEDSMNAEDPAEEDLDSMLEECSTLYEAGCPLEDTMKWLDSIEENIDIAKTSARFYICKARILKSTNDLEEVLHVFEKAVKNCAQPADELAMSLTQIITEISLERERKARLKSALTKEVEDGNVFDSSAIKYCVRQLTPHKNRKRLSGAHNDLEPSPCKVVTPVRRSTRHSLSGLPEQLQDRTPVYRALEDIPSPDRKSTLFLSNPALGYLLDEEGAL